MVYVINNIIIYYFTQKFNIFFIFLIKKSEKRGILMKKRILMSIFVLFLCSCSTQEAVTEPSPEPTPTAVVTQKPIEIDFNSLSTKVKGWGFVRKKGSAPDVPLSQQEELTKYGGYYLGNTENKEIYLTFDEGYENGYTAKILDVLQAHNVPAAFFVTGPYLESQQDLIKRMIDEGHIVGNHTVHHPNLAQCSEEEIKKELNDLNDKCQQLYGFDMTFMRPPEGAYSEKSLAVTQSLGYKTILWSHAYKDWDVNLQLGTNNAIEQVVPYFHNGEILLLHAVSKDNAEALDSIIRSAHEQGYEFKSLTELK